MIDIKMLVIAAFIFSVIVWSGLMAIAVGEQPGSSLQQRNPDCKHKPCD